MKYAIFFLFFGTVLFRSCDNVCDFEGAHELGNNLILFEGDRLEDRIIIRCVGRDEISGCCRGGVQVIPSYEEHYREGKYNEYIEAAKSNDQWIVAKSIRLLDKERPEQYWIISKEFNLEGVDCSKVSCDSIIQLSIVGPLGHEEFLEQKKRLNVNLKIK